MKSHLHGRSAMSNVVLSPPVVQLGHSKYCKHHNMGLPSEPFRDRWQQVGLHLATCAQRGSNGEGQGLPAQCIAVPAVLILPQPTSSRSR